MPQIKTRTFSDAGQLAEALIASVGRKIVLGLPVGIGKAVHVADALFDRACQDPGISLTIFSGLTLTSPASGSGLGARLLGPIAERLYAGWPNAKYATAIANNSLPPNIHVREFYLRPGAYLGNPQVQQSYTSINYSQVTGELLALGVNVIAQLVSASPGSPDTLSLSSNPEITLDLLPELEARRAQGERVAMVGQVNRALPFMAGEAEIARHRFDLVLENDALDFPLFGLPNRRVTAVDYATGMHVASLIPDGGTLQVGIGSFSDAVAHCLRLRHEAPKIFRDILARLPGGSNAPQRKCLPIETAAFDQGLYASTELLSDAVFSLFMNGILKRGAGADDDTLIHAGFFIGSNALYEALRELPEARRKLISMTSISFVNTLYGDEQKKRQQRRNARFVNETMLVTLLGAAASDTLEDGRVVSGVGGQFDFVSMAQSLADSHSILMLRARRMHKGKARSNIRWSYASATVPRHHRDIYVTEYGIAATRGQSDRQVIESLLNIADAAFQAELIDAAVSARKLPAEFRQNSEMAGNTPGNLEKVFSHAEVRDHFPPFPLGSDLTADEQALAFALEWLDANTATKWHKARTVAAALLHRGSGKHRSRIRRLGLEEASSAGDRLLRRLASYALEKSTRES